MGRAFAPRLFKYGCVHLKQERGTQTENNFQVNLGTKLDDIYT